ncbi:hypothetical protein [Kribbella sp. NPDC023855]|uniref:hypothetical protein n=1 Tax=Kribbella sp. NPDC023855 TaxID=3154698 RepID=UPI003406F2F1
MAGRRLGRALLGSGLLGVTLLGGAGGYGLGLLTTGEQASAGTAAAPLAGSPSAPATATPSPKTILPDDSEPLQAKDIRYKVRSFTVRGALQSAVSLRVPGDWELSLPPDTKKYVRYNEPAHKRWIRIEAGFTVQRSPALSMAARIDLLQDLPASQMLTIRSHSVDPKTQDATLLYSYVPEHTLRYVIVRWVANPAGLCHFEIAVTGLPQDKAALEDVLDHAAESATRSDSRLN